jgi:hypothetical protein
VRRNYNNSFFFLFFFVSFEANSLFETSNFFLIEKRFNMKNKLVRHYFGCYWMFDLWSWDRTFISLGFYRFWVSLLFRANFISIMSCYKSPIHSLQLKLLWLSTNDSRFIAAKKAADEFEPQGKCTNIKFLFS